MADKKTDLPDEVRDFLVGMLRRAGGERMDLGADEIRFAKEEGLTDIEVVWEELNTGVEPVEGEEGPKILVLRKKGGK